MTDNNIKLTRRKVLGSVGAVGAAGAAAGLGTSALFSDNESFDKNTITAGTLDLKVDWEEHYSYPQVYGFGDPTAGVDIMRAAPSDTTNYTVLPDPENPLVWVHDDDLDAYMDATAIEAYPDVENGDGGDGVQDPFASEPGQTTEDGVGYICQDGANTDEDLNPDGLRTANADTLTEAGNPKPLVDLTDVKPGDFGELTLSFHLCDNPGYVWLQGQPVAAAENQHTEPEGRADGEAGATDEAYDIRPDGSADTVEDILNSDVELLDAVQTLLWYDDGDNVYEPGTEGGETDVMLVFDKSESMNGYPDDTKPDKLQNAVDGGKALVDSLGTNTRVGLTVFADGIDQNTGVARGFGSAAADIKDDLDGLVGPDDYRPGSKINDDDGEYASTDPNDGDNLNFETQTGVGIKAAREELLASNPSSKKVMVILSDGNPVNDEEDATTQATISKNEDIEIYTIAYGSGANESLMETWASEPKDAHAFVAADPSEVESVFGQVGQIIGGEEAFFRGSLRSLLTELDSGQGIPLDGNRETPFDELGGEPASDAREDFDNSTDNYIGLAWYVPTGSGNEIQSDSVSFNLGFYAEQSRNNDGAA